METARIFLIEKGFTAVVGTTGFSTPVYEWTQIQLLLVEFIIPDA